MRKLASIQRITDIKPIENADSIECVKVLGWWVVAKKDEFKLGDLCVYFEIDSILPKLTEFEFLRKTDYRLKTVRMRGQLSQGLCCNLDLVLSHPDFYRVMSKSDYKTNCFDVLEGLDVTALLGVTKYEEEIPEDMIGKSRGYHPTIVRKTGEVRVQADPRLLDEFKGLKVAYTTKIEGTSASYIHNNGDIDVCSHHHSLLESDDSIHWDMYYKYNLNSILVRNGNIAIQGEIAGPGIMGNPLGLTENEFFVFRITDLNSGKRYTPTQIIDFCLSEGLQHVPMELNKEIPNSLENLLEDSKGMYESSGNPREGIVIVPMDLVYSDVLCDWLSMKVINNDYLLGDWKKKSKKSTTHHLG